MKTLLLFFWCCLATVCAFGADDTRADFLKMIAHPRVPLSPQIQQEQTTNGFTQIHFSFASDAEQRVPGILIKPADMQGRHPAVIVMHGTGGTKEDQRLLLRKLAKKGFIAIAIDGRYHGERTKAGKGADEYQNAIIRAWHQPGEHPFFYDTVWDITRLLDYLETREDIDPKRIGLTGISKGGIETYFTAAIDTRIAAAAPLIGVQSFNWALEHNDWQGRIGTIQNAFNTIAKESNVSSPDSDFVRKFYDHIVPGIYSEFDGPKMVSLIAPRPLLMVNGDSDKNTPLPGVEECIASAQRAYRDAKAEDHFVAIIQKNTPHQVRPESEDKTIEWFVKWLEP